MEHAQDFVTWTAEQDVLRFFDKPVQLKSGKLSWWYLNWRRVTSDAFLTLQLADFVLAKVDAIGHAGATVFGVPEGVTRLAIACQLRRALLHQDLAAGDVTLAMGRSQPKTHGDPDDRYFLGKPTGPTVLLEDVTTTGGSLLSTARQLKEHDVDLKAALVLSSRFESPTVEAALQRDLQTLGAELHVMAPALAILQALHRLGRVPASVSQQIEREIQNVDHSASRSTTHAK